MREWPELPKRVKGALWPYKVVVTDDLGSSNEFVYGYTEPSSGVIKIKKDVRTELQWQTFFHELLHVAEADVGMKPLRDKADDSDVDRLAHGLINIWRRNGWLLPGEE